MSKTVNLSKNENNYFDMQVKIVGNYFFYFCPWRGLILYKSNILIHKSTKHKSGYSNQWYS
jgi:hypothetical protein